MQSQRLRVTEQFRQPETIHVPPPVLGEAKKTRKIWKRVLFFGGLVCILLTIALSISLRGNASVSMFFSSYCLGEWEHPEFAQGKPDGFTKETAARARDQSERMFCSGFTGDVPPETDVEGVVIKLAVGIQTGITEKTEEEEVLEEIPEQEEGTESATGTEAENVSSTETDNASSTEETVSTTSSDVLEDTTEGEEASSTPDTIDIPEAEEETPEPIEPVEPIEEEMTTTTETTWGGFVMKAYAQEVTNEETVSEEASEVEEEPAEESTEETEAPEEESAPEETSLETTEETSTETTEQTETEEGTEAIEEEEEEDDEEEIITDLLLVEYSVDGSQWIKAKTVQMADMENGVITVPMEEVFWSELPSVQVRVKTLADLPAGGSVYLDALWLEVEYGDVFEEIPEAIILGLPETNENLLEQGQFHFQAHEDATFDLILPDATSSSVLGAATGTEAETEDDENDTHDTHTEDDADVEETEQIHDEAETIPQEQTEQTEQTEEEDVEGLKTLDETEVPETIEGTEETEENTATDTEETARAHFFMPRIAYAQEQEEAATDTASTTEALPAEIVSIKVLDPNHTEIDIEPKITRAGNKVRVNLPRPKDRFIPGKYTLLVETLKDGVIIETHQEFTWGVLSINFNRASFEPQETAYIQMAALGNDGHTICEAPLSLTVTTPSGVSSTYSVASGTVQLSGECGINNVTDTPDYFVFHELGEEEGKYFVTLTNTLNGYSIDDVFEVRGYLPFEVERRAATRINPTSPYTMRITLVANEDFEGTITETIPKNFGVISHNGSEVLIGKDVTHITWKKDIRAGEGVLLEYTYHAPQVSPELFLLGPLRIYEDVNFVAGLFGAEGEPVFQENREWQLASDAISHIGVLFYGDTAAAGTIKARPFSSPATWGTATSGPSSSASNILHVVAKGSPGRDETMIGHLKVDGRLDIVTCTTGCDDLSDYTSQWNNPGTTDTQDCDAAPTIGTCDQPFDIGYEATSSRALVVYADNTTDKVYYAFWNGSFWTPNASPGSPGATNELDLPGSAGTPRWIRVIPQADYFGTKQSNRMMVLVEDSNSDLHAFYWDGRVFDSGTTLGASTENCDRARCFDGAWNGASSTSFFALYSDSSDGTNDVEYQRYFVGSGWSGEAQAFTIGSAVMWISVASHPLSTMLSVAVAGQGETATFVVWNSGSWQECSIPDCPDTGTETVAGAQAFATNMRWGSPGRFAYAYNDAGNQDTSDYGIYVNSLDAVLTLGLNTADDLQAIKVWGQPDPRSGSLNARTMFISSDLDCDLNAVMWSAGVLATVADDIVTTLSFSNNACTQGSPVEGMGVGWGYDFVWIPHSAWMRNWRFYDDETVNDPSTGLNGAGENVRPTGVNHEEFIRLRFQLAEVYNATSSENLDYELAWASTTAASTTWIAVGAYSNSNAIWRYATSTSDPVCSLCADGNTISTARLTGTTNNGAYITSQFGIGPNFDLGPGVIQEFDIPLKAENVSTGTTYYFKIQVPASSVDYEYIPQPGLNCLSATCTFPSVTIVEAPAASSSPVISAMSLNGGNNITLTESSFTMATVTMTVSDNDGCSDISSVTAKLYRTATATAGTTCTPSDNDCYSTFISCTATTTGSNQCTGGADTSATYDCSFRMWYIADPTDAGSPNGGNVWAVAATATDAGPLTSTATNSSQIIEVNSLLAFDVTPTIAYGSLTPNADTGATNQQITATNTGNRAIDSETSCDVMCTDYPTCAGDAGTKIPGTQHKYSTTAFTYSGEGTACTATTSPATLELDLAKPTATTSAITDLIFWGLGIPDGRGVGSYTGENVLSATAD